MIYVGPILYGGLATAEMLSWDTTGYSLDIGKTFGGGLRGYYSWPLGFQTGLAVRYDVLLFRIDAEASDSRGYTRINVSSLSLEPFVSFDGGFGPLSLRTYLGLPLVVSSSAEYEEYRYSRYTDPMTGEVVENEETENYTLSSGTALGLNPAFSLRFNLGRVVPYLSLSYPILSVRGYWGVDEDGDRVFLAYGWWVEWGDKCGNLCKTVDFSGPRLGLGVDVRVW